MEQLADQIERFSLMRQHRRMLAQMNCYLTPASRILDFGCGEGRRVYEYRDAGLNAYGFDVRPAAMYRVPADAQYFRFALTGKPVNVPDYQVDASTYRIPFENESFDFVFSDSTMEHVLNHELVFGELARVLKKGGVSIHTFPARYVPIEPHTFVPFGGAIQTYGWFLFWASLGIRNQFQGGMGPVRCARHNLDYARSGVKYLPLDELETLCRRYYRDVEPVPHLWEVSDRGRGTFKGAFLCMPVVHRFARVLYNRFVRVVLFLRK